MLSAPIKMFAAASLVLAGAGVYLARTIDGLGPRAAGGIASPARPAPPPAPVAGYGQVEWRADGAGHFRGEIEVGGGRVSVLVDTGATRLSLTYEDARTLGVAPAPGDYTVDVLTANGRAKAAPLTLAEVRLGTLRVTAVPALVLPREIQGTSLLGMSFLRKLGSFAIADGRLVMKP